MCLGNICRSPMAEAVARTILDKAGLSGAVQVESFGTAGYHAGQGADPQAEAALARHGWPSTGHRARQIHRGDIDRLDLILCADRSNVKAVRALGAPAEKVRLLAGEQEVPDPWGLDDAAFDQALGIIESACRDLVRGLAPAGR